MKRLRIVVAEDAVLFREGLVRLLGDLGHDVVAAVGDAPALLEATAGQRPDLALVDVRMPPDLAADGARAAQDIRRRWPQIGILLLSQHIELHDCLELIGSTGFGYLLKDRVLHLDDFDDALRRVAGGGVALDPDVVRSLVRSRSRTGALAGLSDREREVLALVAEGHSNNGVAALLHVSGRTVEAHMRAIFTKLGLHDDGSTHRRVLAVIRYLESYERDERPSY